jgi:hypothetical protein
MASELLPMLRDVGLAEMESRADTLRSLQTGLDRIATAVHRLAGEQPQADSSTGQDHGLAPSEPEPLSSSAGNDRVPEPFSVSPDRVASSIPLLKALRELQQARARSIQPARDMLEAVISRAEQEVGEPHADISVEAVERILRDLDQLDDEFLREVQERVPAMAGALMRLREQAASDLVTASQLTPILMDVDSLHDRAKAVQATTIMMFLQGLKSFLTATAYRKVEALPQRLQAFEERLMALIPMAQQWVTLGRLERSSIEDILPV